jgi:hypothetical protein
MTISDVLRRVLRRRSGASPSRARAVEEQRSLDAAKAWERRGGPIDPGFVA